MRASWWRLVLAAVLTGTVQVSQGFAADETAKALPTLLIKGEVVSLDTNDPAATLLKVKDRYGFETPIFLTSETKVTQGDTAAASSNLTAGTKVEVEYNFDVNTAKRHAVSVKLAAATPAPSAPMAAAPAAPEASAPAPAAAPVAAQPEAATSAPSAAAPAAALSGSVESAPSTTQ